MSSAKRKPQIIRANITFPDGNHATFTIKEELNPISCFAGIKSLPLVFWYTNGQFATKSGPLDSNSDLIKDVDSKGNLEISFQENEYNLQTALYHAQQTARILFSLTSHPELADCHQSLIAWYTRNYGAANTGKKIPTELDFADYFPFNFLKSAIPKLLKSFDILEKTSIQNDNVFFKLKVITKEKNEFILNATKEGFSIDDPNATTTKYFSTLYTLFYSVSPYFQENSQLVAGLWKTLDKLERIPYESLNKKQVFSDNHKKNSRTKLNIFDVNKEIFKGSIEEQINQIDDKNALKSIICRTIEEQYLMQLCESVKKICEGQSSKDEFLDNDVTFIRITDLQQYQTYSNYIKSINQLKTLSSNTIVYRPIIIECMGQLYLIKSKESETNLLSQFNNSDVKNEFIRKFCDKFSCKEVPQTIKGFVTQSNDGSIQATITFTSNTTPRDYNYPNDSHCFLRPEILTSYEVHVALEKHKDELIKLGGNPLFDYTHDNEDDTLTENQRKALNKRRSDIIKEMKPTFYDISENSMNDSNLRAVANYLINHSIPNFVELFLRETNCQVDGHYIIQKMHLHGINVRYIGQFLKYLPIGTPDEKPMNKTFNLIIQSEMIIRSYKQIVRSNRFPKETLIDQINTLVDVQDEKFDQLFNEISEISQKKFDMRPNKPINEQIGYLKTRLLAQLSLVIGIDSNGIITNVPLNASDITDLNPHAKFGFTQNIDYHDTIRRAIHAYNTQDLSTSFQLFQNAIFLSEQSVLQFDESLIDCYFYCALIFYRTKQLDIAYQTLMQATIMHERHSCYTDASLIYKYNLLASIAAEFGNNRLAHVLFARSAKLSLLIAPSNPWIVQAFTNASDAAANFDSNTALKFATEAIEVAKNTSNQNNRVSLVSTAYATAAMVSMAVGKLPLASKYADEALKLSSSPEIRGLKAQITQAQQKAALKKVGRKGR